MFSTPACSWFWSSILSTEEKELPSIFSAERYFPDSISSLQKLLTDVTAKYFDERFHLGMSSVCGPTMGIRAKTFYAYQLRNALYFFLREDRNIFLTNLQYF